MRQSETTPHLRVGPIRLGRRVIEPPPLRLLALRTLGRCQVALATRRPWPDHCFAAAGCCRCCRCWSSFRLVLCHKQIQRVRLFHCWCCWCCWLTEAGLLHLRNHLWATDHSTHTIHRLGHRPIGCCCSVTRCMRQCLGKTMPKPAIACTSKARGICVCAVISNSFQQTAEACKQMQG